MFSNLGLLATAACPDPKCKRPRCFFSHDPIPPAPPTASSSTASSSATQPAPPLTPTEAKVWVLKNEVAGVKRKIGESSTAAATLEREVKKTSSITSAKIATTPVQSLRPAGSTISDISKPPSLPYAVKATPQPRTDRQKALDTLYTQFLKLYSSVLGLSPSLAHDSTLAQEAEISTTSTSLRAYKTAIHHAAVSISRRAPPDTVPHHSIGTVKESRLATEKWQKDISGALKRDRLEKYILKRQDYRIWRYPDPDDLSLVGKGTGTVPDGEGEYHSCDRCTVSFVVSSKNLKERFGECRYHYGRTSPERIEGRRKWIYSCCGRERGEVGCQKGVHVFRDGEDDQKLARRHGYESVKAIVAEARAKGKDVVGKGYGVVAMDCEMIYATSGSSLGRVTIINEEGAILLDELVRQTVPILDLNTRFSGITPGQLENALMDLPAVREAACLFIGPETIIIGHGLENDLRAMRLLHDKIIDTAAVFPHDKGPPYRRALRDIVKEKLGIFIQDRTSDKGHSSVEDAKATLDVLKWKIREDKEDSQE